MDPRDRFLGSAALAFGAAFLLHAVEHAVRLADVLGGPHHGAIVIAECLEVLQFLVLALATFFAAQHFLVGEKEPTGLRDAALLAAAAYGFGLLADAFTAGVYFSDPHSGVYRTASVLDGVFTAGLLVAALLAALGFSQRDRGDRDRCLGWVGLAFMAANLVLLAAGVLRSEAYTDQGGLGTLTVGLNLGTTGIAAAAAAGALAALAFLVSSPPGEPGSSTARRDLLLGGASGAYALFVAISFSSTAIVAIANAGLGFSTADSVPTWIALLAGLCSFLGAAYVTAGFLPGLAEALRGLRGHLSATTASAP